MDGFLSLIDQQWKKKFYIDTTFSIRGTISITVGSTESKRFCFMLSPGSGQF
jgi:hypothetical protein